MVFPYIMPAQPLDADQLRRALQALAAALPSSPQGDLILIGGAAGMLSGQLPSNRVTSDLDVIDVTPPELLDLCCHHAPQVSDPIGINASWFDASSTTLRHTLLDGWRDRTNSIGRFGCLHVKSVGRLDLIALKLLAGRERDLADVAALRVTTRECSALAELLPQLLGRGVSPESVAAAVSLARALGGDRG